MSRWGNFVGEVVARWLHEDGHDRKMALTEVIIFNDDNNREWDAKPDEIINGASIPPIFWSTFPGSPYIGDYRRAAVLHDVWYARHQPPRKPIDVMFYKAMRADDTDWLTAAVMYGAVRIFGGSAWDGKVYSLPQPVQSDFEAFRRWVLRQGEDVTLETLDDKIEEFARSHKIPM